MSLAAGSRLGPYEIQSALGAGGMGEVYRARDTRLKREVALKLLPESFASDPDRLARFQREAEVLASLNHPNVAAIYGLEEGPAEAGPHVHALVMELVEGETLAERIARGPIPLDEALPIARQIAEALEAAHEQGIIHRDLKPANIKQRPDGTVKVLDFGLAKLREQRSGIRDPGSEGTKGALSVSARFVIDQCKDMATGAPKRRHATRQWIGVVGEPVDPVAIAISPDGSRVAIQNRCAELDVTALKQ
jgi:serine/threonine protein kinase